MAAEIGRGRQSKWGHVGEGIGNHSKLDFPKEISYTQKKKKKGATKEKKEKKKKPQKKEEKKKKKKKKTRKERTLYFFIPTRRPHFGSVRHSIVESVDFEGN